MRVFCCGRRAVNSRFEQLVLLTGKKIETTADRYDAELKGLRCGGLVRRCQGLRIPGVRGGLAASPAAWRRTLGPVLRPEPGSAHSSAFYVWDSVCLCKF